MERIIVDNKEFDCPNSQPAVSREEVYGRKLINLCILGSHVEIIAAFTNAASIVHEWSGRGNEVFSEELSRFCIAVDVLDRLDGSFIVTMSERSAEDKLCGVNQAFVEGINGCMDAEETLVSPDALARAAYLGARSQALALAEEAPSLTDTEIIDSEGLVPEWRSGPQKAGSLVKRTALDQVYRILQTHDSSQNPDWTPEAQPALFGICHTTDPAKAKPWAAPRGASGLYQANECYKDADGAVWRQTYDGENEFDAAALPERWERVVV